MNGIDERSQHWRATRDRNERRCARILQRATPLRLDDLPWDRTSDTAVSAEVLDTLAYMRDVEGFTDRDLAGFTAHPNTLHDPLVGPFLETWRADEAGHTCALTRFLDTYAADRQVIVPARQHPPSAAVAWPERLLSRLGGPVGTVVTTAHMTWGAANELLTLNGYRLLAARCANPLLAQLLGRIADQESRHYTFYFLQAEWRLQASRLARRAIHKMLDRSWTPVGVGDGYKPAADFQRVATSLVSGPDGQRAVHRMDRRLAALPGLNNLRIYSSALMPASP